ncbi:hypothetical protein DVH05_006846 [Phytophthora capsici]|nr:hypothetical protein DVH05_006846 [Phytophthora capsici]|eukprot:jgi/Phyca11/104265/e_gw1.9.908.1
MAGRLQCVLLAVVLTETGSFAYSRAPSNELNSQVISSGDKRVAIGGWIQEDEDLTAVDTDILPDYWERIDMQFGVDRRVPTNGAEPPEQLVKVTDRKHKFPVFATICSLSFFATVIILLIVCTN